MAKPAEQWTERDWKGFEHEAFIEVTRDKEGGEIAAKHSIAVVRIVTARLRRCIQGEPKSGSCLTE